MFLEGADDNLPGVEPLDQTEPEVDVEQLVTIIDE